MSLHNRSAVVSFSAHIHCFVCVPESWKVNAVRDSQVITVKIESESGVLYSTVSGQSTSQSSYNSSEDVIEINGLFGAKQGFKNGQVVSVTEISNVPFCSFVHVEPASVDDWEILEMNAEYIESNLLNQLRLIAVGHVFPVWVHKACILVKAGEMEPNQECCILQPQTQVIVSPKFRSSSSSSHSVVSDRARCGFASADVDISETHREGKTANTVHNLSEVAFSPINRLVSGFRRFLFGSETDLETGNIGEPVTYKPEAWNINTKLFCRVLALDDFTVCRRATNSATGQILAAGDSCISEPSSDEIWPGSDFFTDSVDLLQQPTNVYISIFTVLSQLPAVSIDSVPDTFLATLSRLRSPSERQASNSIQRAKSAYSSPEDVTEHDSTMNGRKTVVRVIVVDFNAESHASGIRFKQPISQKHILISSLLRRQMNLSLTGKVALAPLRVMSDTCPAKINVYPLFSSPQGYTNDMLLQALRYWLDHCTSIQQPLVVSRGMLISCFIKPDTCSEFIVSFDGKSKDINVCDDDDDSSRIKYCLISRCTLERMSLVVRNQLDASDQDLGKLQVPDIASVSPVPLSPSLSQLVLCQETITQALCHIDICLKQQPLARHMSGGMQDGALLLCGIHGVGKTALASALCHKAMSVPNYAFIRKVDCKLLHGKRPESVATSIQATFDEAAWHEPSIVVLDDLDQIAMACSGPDQEMSGEALYHAKIAQIFRQIFKSEIQNSSLIAVIATSRSVDTLHKTLTSSRGQHFFSTIIELKPPNHDDRAQFLGSILQQRSLSMDMSYTNVSVADIASKTEGYVFHDLEMLTDRAIHIAVMARTQQTSSTDRTTCLRLDEHHFHSAFEKFTPSTIHNVPVLKPSELSWSDVGGLHDVRIVLQQTLLWPTKYPKLFSSCPLRIRSGLLLYGAPGTGKTLIAGVIAKEYGLNFICIKGPELLNKYIGASELAVRDTFVRAQSARPCILFFDEFDSLAPRRGHDSTGVTDRVVNQLLTQLDGIETLEGVYVLAATSRPDLIDPALLRPGRLDKALHCPLPSEGDRVEILQALSRHLSLADDVNLNSVAAACEFFTGADLKALLYDSQLSALSETGALSAECSDVFDVSQSPGLEKAATELEQKDDIVYIQNVTVGCKALDKAQYGQLVQQIPVSLRSPKSQSTAADSQQHPDTIVVTQHHLMEAASNLRPSVSPAERYKYQQIYESFVASRGGNFSDSLQTVGKHVTLA